MIEETIRESYKVFQKYKVKNPLDVCTECCMLEIDAIRLSSLPLLSITSDLLAEYNDGAATEKTPVEEIKHFLPRYMDLINQFQIPSHSIALTFKRLMPFDETEWLVEEKEILNKFAIDFFEKCLTIYPLPDRISIIDVIIMFWKGGINIDAVISNWESSHHKASLLHFRDLYFYGFQNASKTKLSNLFADNDLSIIISAWVKSEKAKDYIESHIHKWLESETEISQVDVEQVFSLFDSMKVKSI